METMFSKIKKLYIPDVEFVFDFMDHFYATVEKEVDHLKISSSSYGISIAFEFDKGGAHFSMRISLVTDMHDSPSVSVFFNHMKPIGPANKIYGRNPYMNIPRDNVNESSEMAYDWFPIADMNYSRYNKCIRYNSKNIAKTHNQAAYEWMLELIQRVNKEFDNDGVVIEIKEARYDCHDSEEPD